MKAIVIHNTNYPEIYTRDYKNYHPFLFYIFLTEEKKQINIGDKIKTMFNYKIFSEYIEILIEDKIGFPQYNINIDEKLIKLLLSEDKEIRTIGIEILLNKIK